MASVSIVQIDARPVVSAQRSVGAGASVCVTVTSTGLSIAPAAVIRMVAVRAEVPMFDVKLQLMVPVSVPLAPEVIESQLLSDVTAAVHGIVPVPVLETLNVVVPASFETERLVGEITNVGAAPV